MNVFNVSLDKDMSFLIKEIGHDIKINNTDSRALINNKDNAEYDFDDKEIISKSELTRGQYVNYNNKNWIVISEINDKRYNSYRKGLIRACNHDVNFVIDKKLYKFYSIIEPGKTRLEWDAFFVTMSDEIKIIIPHTNITKKIALSDRIIKFNAAWKITSIDYTKDKIITIYCERDTIDKTTDDVEREIADKNKLDNPNQEPILPFEDDGGSPEEPEEPEEPERNYRIEIDGYDRIMFGTFDYYYVTVYENDVEVEKELKFEIIGDETLMWVSQTSDNWCIVSVTEDRRFESAILRVSLAEDETVYAEMEISAVAF